MSEPAVLQGKIAIVTGAGSNPGLGRVMTFALLRAGARVAMLDVDHDMLEATADEARKLAGRDAVLPVFGDVSKPDDAANAVERTVQGLGGLHILVNNAGINPRIEGDFTNIPPDLWIKTLSVNTFGPFFMARAAVPHLKRQGWGRVIGVTTSLDTMIRGAPYGPSKAGHEALIATMACELEGTGVTANVLIPGGAASTNMIPIDRRYSGLIDPAVMESPVVWLASEASNGFNGRRIIAQDWDEALPIEERLKKSSAPAAWPQLGRSVRP